MAIHAYYHVTPAGAGAKDGSTWAAAMGEAELEAFLEGSVVAGDVFFLAGGTYTLDSAYNSSARLGAAAAPIALIGVKAGTTHEGAAVVYSDWALDDTDRPFFDCGSYQFRCGSYYAISNLRIEGDASYLFFIGAYCTLYNCKLHGDIATSNSQRITASGGNSLWYRTEFYAEKCAGIEYYGNDTYAYCYFHDFSDATNGKAAVVGGPGAQFIECLFKTCTVAISGGTTVNALLIEKCTFYECATAVTCATAYGYKVINNLFDGCTVDAIKWTTQTDINFFNGNHGDDARNTDMWDGVDTSTVFQDYEVTTGDPLFTSAGMDFSLQSTSPCFETAEDIALGVGATPRHGNKGASQAGRVAPTYAAVGNVLSGVDRGDGTTGTRVDADADYYAPSGPVYGDPGAPTSGTADLPALSSVLTTDTLLGDAGTFDEAARNTIVATKVEDGYAYIHLGSAATGTLAVKRYAQVEQPGFYPNANKRWIG